MVAPMFDRLQRAAEQLIKREAREDLKLLGQSYLIALKNEAKKPDRHALLCSDAARSSLGG